MKLEWLLLAEGIAEDSKGAFTLVSVNQNLVFVPQVPVTTKRAVMAHLSLSKRDFQVPNGKLSFEFEFLPPSGLGAQRASGEFPILAPPFRDYPVTLDIPVEMVIPIAEHGEHVFQLTVQGPDGRSTRGRTSLFVLPQEQFPGARPVGGEGVGGHWPLPDTRSGVGEGSSGKPATAPRKAPAKKSAAASRKASK
jgi:hypothetical protein